MVVIRRVLVTRPQPGTDATAARLREMRFAPVLLPLTRIEAIEPEPPADLSAFDAVVFTSVNAVRHTPSDIKAALLGKPVYAVGEASAEAARAAGFRVVFAAAGTARDLAALIIGECPAKTRILHPAGVERTAGFAGTLKGAGIALTLVEVYRAEKISYATDFLCDIARQGALWGALAMSPRAGVLLGGLAARHEIAEAFENTRFFCISDNAAAPLSGVAPDRVFVSDTPDENGVLALLSSQG